MVRRSERFAGGVGVTLRSLTSEAVHEQQACGASRSSNIRVPRPSSTGTRWIRR